MTPAQIETLARRAFDVVVDIWAAEMPGWWALSWDRLDAETRDQYRTLVRKLLEDL